jgi:hypothetical protein
VEAHKSCAAIGKGIGGILAGSAHPELGACYCGIIFEPWDCPFLAVMYGLESRINRIVADGSADSA